MSLMTNYEGNKTFGIGQGSLLPPEKGEVLLKVDYCGICGTDIHIYHGLMDQRVKMPMTIGHEMSGTVHLVGPEVTEFTKGDKVVVRPLDPRSEKPSDKGYSHICRQLKFIGIDSPGAMQQYWTVPAFTLHKLPGDIDMQLAALIEPLAVACHDVRRSRLKKNETAVVLGGGPIGLLVALVARHHGASVFISEINPNRLELASRLGFQTMNPREDDVITHLEKVTEGYLADVVFEVAGVKDTVDMMTRLAGIRGRIVMVAIHGKLREVDLFQFFWKELELIGARVYEKADYEEAIKLVTNGDLPLRALISKIEPISRIQRVFEEMDRNPAGMKVLLDCQAWE